MFVTNHVLSGALLGRVLRGKPFRAFAAGIASHLLIDAIPHWGCLPRGVSYDDQPSETYDRFFKVAKRDGVLGATLMASLALSADRKSRSSTVAAMAGAVLLDMDKPLFHYFQWNPFPMFVQHIHGWVQNESDQGMPNEVFFGGLMALADAITISRSRRALTPDLV
jgi:hypothetical protein